MRGGARRRLALLGAVASVAALSVAATQLDATGSAAGEARKARLVVASEAPLVLAGSGFRSGERVTVTASVSGASLRRTLSAGGRGRFTARFRTGPACSPIYARAVGSEGSRASVRKQVIPGPCGVDLGPAP